MMTAASPRSWPATRQYPQIPPERPVRARHDPPRRSPGCQPYRLRARLHHGQQSHEVIAPTSRRPALIPDGLNNPQSLVLEACEIGWEEEPRLVRREEAPQAHRCARPASGLVPPDGWRLDVAARVGGSSAGEGAVAHRWAVLVGRYQPSRDGSTRHR